MNTPAERYEALTAAGSADERPGATPFVGREQQLTALTAALVRARDERTCRIVTVAGPPGIGKSRLVREFTRTLGEDATVVVGRCLSYGEGITYRPLAEIVRQLGPDPATRLAELLEGDAQAEPVTRAVLGTVGLAKTAGSSDDTFWAFRRLFEALARERAFVAVFEDLHWAEPRLLDLLDSVTASHDALRPEHSAGARGALSEEDGPRRLTQASPYRTGTGTACCSGVRTFEGF